LDEPCGDINQLITGSLDGQVYFWDLRFKKEIKMLDLTWRPTLRVNRIYYLLKKKLKKILFLPL